MIGIIDYDAGNIKSVEKALQYLGQETVVSRDPQVLLKADKVILPGVGSFGDAMENLKKYGLVPVIHEIVEKGTPFLGICLGLQLLFESSEETPGVEGIGILKGKILRIPPAEGLKIPHMGWNSLHLQNNGRLFQGIPAHMRNLQSRTWRDAQDFPLQDSKTFHSRCLITALKKQLQSKTDSKKGGSFFYNLMYDRNKSVFIEILHSITKTSNTWKNHFICAKKYLGISGNNSLLSQILKCFFHTFYVACVVVDNCYHLPLPPA